MTDFDRQLEQQREAIESPAATPADAPEWADTEDPRPFYGHCSKCGNSLLKRGPLCAVCKFDKAVQAAAEFDKADLTAAQMDAAGQ